MRCMKYIIPIFLLLIANVNLHTVSSYDQPLIVWVEDAMTRVGINDVFEEQKNIHIFAARNEWEPFQIIASANGRDIKVTNIIVSDLKKVDESNVKISAKNIYVYREYYVHINHSSSSSSYNPGHIPDALIPLKNPYTGEDLNGSVYDAIPFSLEDGENQPIWIDIFIPKDTPAGNYVGNITIVADELVDSVSIYLTVWNFSLPSVTSLCSSFSANDWQIREYYGEVENLFVLMRKYYDILLDHHLMPDIILDTYPYLDLDSCKLDFNITYEGLGTALENLKYYLDERGMRVYQLPIWEDFPYEDPFTVDREKIKKFIANYGKFFAMYGWDGRLYAYIIDEPNDALAYQKVREWGEIFDEVEEEYGIHVDFLVTEQPIPDNEEWGSLAGYVDIWVPLACEFWLDENYYKEHAISSRISAGDKVWCYTALAHPSDEWWELHGWPSVLLEDYPPVWLLDYPPINYRIYPWLYHCYNITGMLYWETIYWCECGNPWKNPGTLVAEDEVYNGEGMLIYPGKEDEIGFDGPVASMRLKWIREGIEDYEYIKMLRERNESKAYDILHQVARNMADWEISPDKLYKARKEIGKFLEENHNESIRIIKPRTGIYIFDNEIMPSNKTIIIGKITIEVETTGNKVEFYIDNELKYIDDDFPYEWLWDEFTIGNYEIKVIAYDMEGNKAEDEISVIIFNLGRK